MKRKLKRSNTISLTDYRNRILSQHKRGNLYVAFSLWINYKHYGGLTDIIKITNAVDDEKRYYLKEKKKAGLR